MTAEGRAIGHSDPYVTAYSGGRDGLLNTVTLHYSDGSKVTTRHRPSPRTLVILPRPSR